MAQALTAGLRKALGPDRLRDDHACSPRRGLLQIRFTVREHPNLNWSVMSIVVTLLASSKRFTNAQRLIEGLGERFYDRVAIPQRRV